MKTTLHIPDDLHERLKIAAARDKTSLSEILRRLALAAYPASGKRTK